jgi:hypothetical protein
MEIRLEITNQADLGEKGFLHFVRERTPSRKAFGFGGAPHFRLFGRPLAFPQVTAAELHCKAKGSLELCYPAPDRLLGAQKVRSTHL